MHKQVGLYSNKTVCDIQRRPPRLSGMLHQQKHVSLNYKGWRKRNERRVSDPPNHIDKNQTGPSALLQPK